jgi:hypothetical protein
MLEHFTIATFADHLQASFRLFPDSANSETSLELVLIEATDLSPRAGPAAAASRRAPFSLVFRGPPTPILSQRIYRLEHAEIGRFDLFLVPIGPDERGMRYEAVFT